MSPFPALLCSTAILMAGMLPVGTATAQCQYEVTAVIESNPCPPFGIRPGVRARAMNNLGHVVGYWDCGGADTHGFVWTPETGVVELPRPAGIVGMTPSDINDHGVIVGTWANSNISGFRGFVYWPDTQTYTELDTLSGSGHCMAYAINNDNVVVGERSTEKGILPRHGFVWSVTDGFQQISPEIQSGNLVARDINANGVVVGIDYTAGNNEAFFWFDGQKHLLGPMPTGNDSFGFDISIDEQIVGNGTVLGLGHVNGYVYKDGEFTVVPPLPGFESSSLSDINSAGVAVGQSVDTEAPTFRAILWQSGVRYDLNDLVVLSKGFFLQTVGDINDDGVILALGFGMGFMLTPVGASLGDVNRDCNVDELDLLQLIELWNLPDTSADLNDSGRVDVFDLLLLLSKWTG